ncbi:TonB-dependent receptor [Veronia pacifica]|uniref:TonB-dependent receptor n=1 Tax=Veronia pacifica TaxID=1080227 RepID=A0A1C3EMC9_9GAMM|nr:TonB-dependent receptor [Veronia pacifica]ODA34375.1 hypothetical protein A8L45_06530 [Veronia pacifica]
MQVLKTVKLSPLVAIMSLMFSHGVRAQDIDKNEENEAALLDVIMVTADRREESAFDVPTSIQVFDAVTIETRGYENTQELINAVPNANITNQRAGLGESNFSIRGVGTTAMNVDQSIGFYVDETPVASVAEFGSEYFDISQVEVLKGPQGTLYGRNALGGVLHIKTNNPEAENSARGIFSYGSDNQRRISLTGNAMLGSEDLLGRINIVHGARDGRIKNIAVGADDVDESEIKAARGKLLYRASDDLSFLISADISESEQTTGTGVYDKEGTESVNTPRPANLDIKSHGLSVRAEYLLDTLDVISLTSVRKHKLKGQGGRPELQNYVPAITKTIVFNNDFTGELDQDTFTQEIRVESDADDSFFWTAGLFFQHNNAERISDVINVSKNLFERSFADINDHSVAIFGDATYEPAPEWAFTAGIRASHDKKEIDYRHVGSFAPLFGFNFAPNQALKLEEKFNDVSPRAVVEYKGFEGVNLYAKATRGFKAGGFNTEFLGPVNDPYQKESIWSYESGFKTRFLDNRVELDGAIFYMDWSDQQVLVFENGISKVTNADSSSSKGAEFQLRAKPMEGLLLSASAGYVDARFDSLAIDGNTQPNTPKWSGTVGASYETELFSHTNGYIATDVSYKSSFYWDVDNTLEEPEHTFINLSTGLKYHDVDISLFASNLGNEKYRVFGIKGSPGFFEPQGQPGHGREVGIKVSTTF